ncbi:MAG: hypothetical protein M3Q29_12655 [Chloroflexota bacterium]|nr:hypothetical protein [Chloroflexota bacterium]
MDADLLPYIDTAVSVVNALAVLVALFFARQAAVAGLASVREMREARKMEEGYRREQEESHEQELMEQEERHREAREEAAAERERQQWNQKTERMAEIAQLVVEVRQSALVLKEENRLREPSQIPPADGSEWPIRGLAHTHTFDAAQLRLRAALARVERLPNCRKLAGRRDHDPSRRGYYAGDEGRPFEVTSAVVLDCIRLSEEALDEVLGELRSRGGGWELEDDYHGDESYS